MRSPHPNQIIFIFFFVKIFRGTVQFAGMRGKEKESVATTATLITLGGALA